MKLTGSTAIIVLGTSLLLFSCQGPLLTQEESSTTILNLSLSPVFENFPGSPTALEQSSRFLVPGSSSMEVHIQHSNGNTIHQDRISVFTENGKLKAVLDAPKIPKFVNLLVTLKVFDADQNLIMTARENLLLLDSRKNTVNMVLVPALDFPGLGEMIPGSSYALAQNKTALLSFTLASGTRKAILQMAASHDDANIVVIDDQGTILSKDVSSISPWVFQVMTRTAGTIFLAITNTSPTVLNISNFHASSVRISSTGMAMVPVKGGTFTSYGSGGNKTVQDFEIGQFEVTREQWIQIMNDDPNTFTGTTNLPVENVSWYDAVLFCNRLSLEEGLEPVYTLNYSVTGVSAGLVSANPSKNGYRLPSADEWYGAARGMKAVLDDGNFEHQYPPSPVYPDTDDLIANYAQILWYEDNSGLETQPVGTLLPNTLGLFDVFGNVAEWNTLTGSTHNTSGGDFDSSLELFQNDSPFDPSQASNNVANHADQYTGFRLARRP